MITFSNFYIFFLQVHLCGHSGELLEIPSRNLNHAVVQTWFKTSRRGVFLRICDRVPQNWQGDSQGQFGCHISKGITRGFTSQGRAPRQTGIHFNDEVLKTNSKSKQITESRVSSKSFFTFHGIQNDLSRNFIQLPF